MAIFLIGLISIPGVNGVLVDNTFIGNYVVKDDLALINNQTYFISKPYDLYDSNQTIIFHNVVFAMPAAYVSPPDPSGVVFSLVKFPDGSTEKLGVGIPLSYPLTALSIHTSPQAAFTRFMNNTFAFLVSQDLGLSSPLKQFKSGIKAEDVKCNTDFELVIKSTDDSPACVKSTSIQRLLGQGWINPYNFNGENISNESIILSAYQGASHEAFYNNGTVASDFAINVSINNFKPSNTPLILQVYYNDGTLYKTVTVSSHMIQPDGSYKYQLTAVSDENHPAPFKVVATYNNETAIAYAPVFAHP